MKASIKEFFVRKDLDGSCHIKVRPWRWLTALALASFFVFSYTIDLQALEGSMVASRLMGFHMVDLFGGLEVIAAHGKIATNLAMGLILVFVVYWILGGRTFCSWACPFGLVSEWAESLHLFLVEKKIIKKRKKLTTKYKYVIAFAFLLTSGLSGYLIYQHVNLVGIFSRVLIYGLVEAFLLVIFELLIEVFFYQRVWCRSICPSGATFGLLNKIAIVKLEASKRACDHCGDCVSACHVPEALSVVFSKKGGESVFLNSTDCTMCGKCMDACTRGVFHFSHRLKRLI